MREPAILVVKAGLPLRGRLFEIPPGDLHSGRMRVAGSKGILRMHGPARTSPKPDSRMRGSRIAS